MECLVKILLWSALVTWTTNRILVNAQFRSKFSKKEVFFVNLEEGFFGCQVNETLEVLQIFKIEKLCDGTSDCYLGSDENQKELKCSNNCLYTTGHRCINGACLDSQCHCNDGWGGKGCSMPDENECKYRPCDVFAHCTNNIGSYECTCFPGYEGDGHSCQDIDECSIPELAGKCVENAECCNLPAEYVCKCKQGFEGDGQVECRDIDECREANVCGSNSLCNNYPGNYTCTCQDGYAGDPYTGCVDLNECLSNPCGAGARCINQYGGYVCECPPGARGDPYTNCGSLDQCQNNPCGVNAKCYNEGSSHRCECPQGFQGNPTQQCIDINECLRNPCGQNAECLNTEGSYQCTCKPGLTGDPFTGCSDTDECSAQVNPCGANAVCRNTNPGFTCECPPGFTGNGNVACEATEVRTLCKSNFDCTNNAKCSNGQCICRPGFTAAGTQCLDVDECRSTPGICGANAVCVNTLGSFTCSCLPSFVGNPPSVACSEPCKGVKCSQHAFCKAQDKEAFCECEPGWTYDPSNIAAGCVDVNECGQPGTCGDNSVCTNLPGSYICQCKPGYTGNPQVRCIDIDECKSVTTCGFGRNCENLPGSYRCGCPAGAIPDPNNPSECLNIKTCKKNQDCPGNAFCSKEKVCVCPEPNQGPNCESPCANIFCAANSLCTLLNGEPRCMCHQGYQPAGPGLQGCIDVNECLGKPCGNGAFCDNTPGGYRCLCPSGFTGDPNVACVGEQNKEQCSSARPCPSGELCSQGKCVCQRGFQRESSGLCRDIDECAGSSSQNPVCGQNAFCKNLPGSFDCECPTGYNGNPFISCKSCNGADCGCPPPYNIDSTGNCVLEGCKTKGDCADGAECVSIAGGVSYCACPTGFNTQPDGTCADIDECSATSRPCGFGALCENKIGSFSCVCPLGTTGDPYNGLCSANQVQCSRDDDCRPNEKCVEPGQCICPPPFFADTADGGKCKSPCERFQCGINADCSPTNPPQCLCKTGYGGDPIRGCLDVDECLGNPCGPNARCVNEDGSYKCQCPRGTRGDPYLAGCVGTPSAVECANDEDCPGQLACSAGSCINPCSTIPCGQDAVCIPEDHAAWCRCRVGYKENPETGKCTSMCEGMICGLNAQCIIAADGPTCACSKGTFGNPFPGGSCVPETCSAANPCPGPLTCISGQCRERCDSSSCGLNAACDSNTNKCFCKEGFVGDGNFLCMPPILPAICTPGCGSNSHCVYNVPNKCECNPGFGGNPYEACAPSTDVTVSVPCQCGTNAECATDNYAGQVCKCRQGYDGNPFVGCYDINECGNTNSCGKNAVCINSQGSFDCRCQPGYKGNPFEGCVPDQPLVADLCSSKRCGPNAVCKDGQCLCLTGFQGDANDVRKGCQSSSCSTNLDCGYNEICQSVKGQYRCVDACGNVQCGPNSRCVTDNHHSTCICQDGFTGNPLDLRSGCSRQVTCSSSSDCQPGTICSINISGKKSCVDPCRVMSCGSSEKCVVRNNRPFCECSPDHIRDPLTNQCELAPVPSCTNDNQCSQDQVCKPDSLGVLRCTPVCQLFTCPPNSQCRASNHQGFCHCFEGYSGNPKNRNGCYLTSKDQCTNDAQCGEEEVCSRSLKKCIPACTTITCGPQAVCITQNHSPRCTCPPGKFKGDPTDPVVGCRAVSCLTNEDCPPTKFCDRLSYKCMDVCTDDTCGTNAVCLPENQRPKCSCPPGTRPDPLPEVGCTTINACSNNPCHRSAKCRPTATGFSCLCPQGQVGDPYKSGCFPEGSCPNGDRDCPDQSICISGRCKNVCYDGCGPNTECTISNRQAQCQCLVGFIPSPLDPRTCIRDSQVCTRDTDCVGGSTCQSGTCRYACRGQNDCLVGEQCSASMCMISCISSQQCPASQVCSDGVCSVGCRNNQNCPSDEVCINFKCINPCQQEGACGPNALCSIFNKNVQCKCPERFAGVPQPQQGCVRIPSRCPNNQCPPAHTCKGGLCHLQCQINADCAKGERCLEGVCTKVCHSDKNCLQGEICIETSCQPGCNKEEDCRPGEICQNGNCVCGLGFINTPSGCTDIDECQESRCHPSAQCQNTPGSFKCSCPRGLIGDPYSGGCKDPNECRTNRDCGDNLACAGDGSGYRKCVNPCDRARCGSNTECLVVNNRPQCRCAAKHVGNPNQPLGCTKVECEQNGDCSGDKICQVINNRCVDACSQINCGRGTCSAENHVPSCRCEPGYIFSNNRCVDIDECQNSPCEPTAVCVNTIGAYQCQCPPGTVPDQFGRCRTSDQCLTDSDCPRTASCYNGKCQNPCDVPGSCGADAICTPANHRPMCSCPPRTSGNPQVRCVKLECLANNDCPGERTCVRNKCVDVCSLPNVCGQNTNCRARNHVARCMCLPGFTGEPTLGCTQLQLCTSEEQCPSGMLCSFGICSPPCQSSRDCLDNQLCNGGSCISKCSDSSQCPPLHSCQNSLCVQESRCSNDVDCGDQDTCVGRESGLFECEDACAGPVICGRNAQCASRGHKAICTCPDGFFGNPNDEKTGCQKKQCLVNGDCRGDFVCDKFVCKPQEISGSCTTDRNCAATEVCQNGKCLDPCSIKGSCGLNAICSVQRHRKQCVCPQDFTGNPEVECVRIPSTCYSSTDCPQPLQCSDGICMPSCTSDESCALNERCLQGLCMLTCRVDNDCFLGHVCLNKMCIVGCRKNSDCPESNTCINNRCTDPCTTACGPNAKCQVVNHRAQCSCPTGYIPNPSPVVACVKQPQICSSNAQCPDRQVCDGSFCKDVCFNDKTCGKNEVCDNGLCKAMCRVDDDCNSQEICRGVTCVLGCRSSSSCPPNLACINNQCSDPCTSSTASCGSNAVCSVINHQAQCSCPPGLTGDPSRACSHPIKQCRTSQQCGPGLKCIGGTCAVTCSSNNENCLLNEVCVQGTCRPLCNSNEDCSTGYICKERFCTAGCTADSQCGKSEACINSECQNPCLSSKCGPCAECSVTNHEAFCSCPPTATGNPLTGCLPLTYACSRSSDCNPGDTCDDGVCVKKCRSGSDCECGKTCVAGKCRQECNGNIPCPQGHLCQGGTCLPGCLLNTDCSDQEICHQGQCKNPCSLASTGCARSAECRVSNHRPVCLCPQGLQGNPKVECRKVECSRDKDCESGKSCVQGSCVNLCQEPNACGVNAQCKVIGHRKKCTCPVNFIGNPNDECVPDKNECLPNPCGPNALCQDLVGGYDCQCRPGCTGDPFSGCLCSGPLIDPCSVALCGAGALCTVDINNVALCVCPSNKPHGDPLIECVSEQDGKCRGDFDCPVSQSCHRGRCVDPCSLRAACGKNAICSVTVHKPRCECPQCHIGQPLVACRPDPACNNVPTNLPSIVDGCSSDKSCPLTAACSRQTKQCYDPCARFSCDSNKICEVSNHKPVCKCKYSLVVNQQGVLTCPDRQVECRGNDECPSNQGCEAGRCVNPCDRRRVCATGKECQVLDHKAVCVCTTGCNPSVSICLKDKGCPRNQACINLQCKNPCDGKICPGNTPCIVEDHQPICKFCPPGFVVDANYGCIQGSNVGCRSNSECPAKQACQNKKCVNPCSVGLCSATQDCQVANHRAKCIDVPRCECQTSNDCREARGRGYKCEDCECVRDPLDIEGNVSCDFDDDECAQCTQNDDCAEDKYCDRFQRKCISVCPGFCGDNTVCSFANHNPICSCKPGFQGNADVGCSSIPVPTNPCIPSPCGAGAVCELDNGNPICSCPRGKTGNPFVRCITDGAKCKGNQCGPNSGCRMIADRPVCYCLPRFEGNPPAIPCARPLKQCKPNPCGANTECVVVNNVQRCTCRPGYTESINTIQGCVPISEPTLSLCEPGPCGENAECLITDIGEDCRCYDGFSGDAYNGCVPKNPCQPSPCGPNTECSEDRQGQVICTCRRGFQGDPVSSQGCRAECLQNGDCSQNLACIAQKCIDPCPGTCGVAALCEVRQHNPICSCPPGMIGDPFSRCVAQPPPPQPQPPRDPCNPDPCGINALCKVQSGQAVCQCIRDYQGDPLQECKPECLLSYDCAPNLACINTKCLDPCPGTCGINAHCTVLNHNPVCKCNEGYLGDPFVQCSLDPLSIIPPEPVDPCTPSPCGPNAVCQVDGARPVCSCLPGYYGAPPDCRPECVINSECAPNLACINLRCTNPCVGVCGINARCDVVAHNPICSCPTGFIGDPFTSCRQPPAQPVIPEPTDPCNPDPCGPYSECRPEGPRPVCSCLKGYFGGPPNCRPECLLSSECHLTKACVQQKCVDPCPGTCGANAECKVVNHNPICSCPRGFSGDPFYSCNKEPEVTTPSERPHIPCVPSPCGPNAQCREINGYESCTCLPGYIGAPPNCRPECVLNAECPSNKACIQNKCSDPCVGACGYNARCTAVAHNAICNCPAGYTGDPFSGCSLIPEVITKPEPVDPCNPSPCGANAECSSQGRAGACRCIPDHIGDPYVGCRPECLINTECPNHLACVQKKCKDPCPGTCGINAQCSVRNHNPICTCNPGYQGDATSACTLIPQTQEPIEADLDPCDPNPCGPNSQHREVNGVCVCACTPGYQGNPPNCRPECVVSSDCSQLTACINQKCVDPCPGTCGNNARCQVTNHNPICQCPPGFTGDPFSNCVRVQITTPRPLPVEVVDPCDPSPCGPFSQCQNDVTRSVAACTCLPNYIGVPPNCRPECSINPDCPSNRACVRERCIDPCPGSCGPNAECQVINHQPICRCPPGYDGDPFRECRVIITTTTVRSTEIIDPCDPSPCGSNAQCQSRQRAGACTCIPGYFGDPYLACRPECVLNTDCPTNRACVNNKCVDPCPGVCGINAVCNANRHQPICTCLLGYEGDPITQCKLKPTGIPILEEIDPCDPNPCGPYSQFREGNGVCICSCEKGMIGAPPNCRPECLVSSECSQTTACIQQQCRDPCPGLCGFNAECRVTNHNPICTCNVGYEGDPFTGCTKIPEAIRTTAPPVPIDPCNPDPCGPFAQCRRQENIAACSCLPGYVGTPPNCRPECRIHSECASNLACISEKCRDPCPGACGVYAECEVINHNAVCRCQQGYEGDPFRGCRRVTTPPPPPRDPCNPNPCGANADARVSGSSCICSCRPEYFGDPYSGCRPECVVNSDCATTKACVNQHCIDPCPGVCGFNAECRVINHNPVCTCVPGYIGDPFRGCSLEPTPVVNDPCDPNPCGPGAIPRQVGDECQCTCPPGLFGDPYRECKPECVINSDCPNDKACRNYHCYNPCDGTCGQNAQCEVRNHSPLCSCLPGYIGNALIECHLPPPPDPVVVDPCEPNPCGQNAIARPSGDRCLCTCPPGLQGDPFVICKPECTVDSDCPNTLACISQKCKDPCVYDNQCGINAICQVNNHRSNCICPPGYEGNAYQICTPIREPPKPECVSDPECPVHLACIGQKCRDPCIPEQCGDRAICRVNNHRAVCVCPPPLEGNPYTACIEPGCKSDLECPLTDKCVNRNCVLACSLTQCGVDALCESRDHRARCYCPERYRPDPDPYIACIRPECVVDQECPQVLACRNEHCVDPCDCAVNAQCIVRSHRHRCQCYDGYTGDPYHGGCYPIPEPQPECRVDADCPSRQACLNEVCRNPCLVLSPCGQNAECTVQNTLPQRTMICMCIPGYVGDADIACNLPPPPPSGCSSNNDCGDKEICRDRSCLNPCIVANPCAQNAVCDVRSHSVTCNCPSGFTGDPFANCYPIQPRPECTQDPDCPQNEACINENCIDPCIVNNPCAPQATCTTRAHHPVCTCPQGYGGDPYRQCYRPECRTDNDCPVNKACINENCLNPCLNTDRPCGRGAECIVEFHQARCVCSVGLQGNPLVACVNVECRVDDDCRQDQACDFLSQTCQPVCGPDTCAQDATCTGINHQPECSCNPGTRGNPFLRTGCIRPIAPIELECRVDDDCGPRFACINNECVDPCEATRPCHHTQICRVQNSSPIRTVLCTCPEDTFIGPNGECKPKVTPTPACVSDRDCRDPDKCVEGTCRDACNVDPCGANAICKSRGHASSCTCPIGYTGNPRVQCLKITPDIVAPNAPECRDNSECPLHNACINRKCLNPCAVTDPCATNAYCKVANHEPVCTCPSGYIGDPRVQCIKPEPVAVLGCTTNDDCPQTEACFNRDCADPCNCGTNAQCFVTNHKPVCFCPEGYTGDPEVGCVKVGCSSDSECAITEVCTNRNCLDACIANNPCAPNAECYSTNHQSACRCPPGLEGDPYVNCVRVECRINQDCSQTSACINNKCANPCLYENPCAPSATCSVQNHNAKCTCPPGWVGNPLVSCRPKEEPVVPDPEPECITDGDCPDDTACLNERCENPCHALSPCHVTSVCSVVNSLPFRTMICSCRPGWEPETDTRCKPVEIPNPPGCARDDDCPNGEACINRQCKDPCDCGTGAQCFVEDHRPVCVCPPGYVGNPQISCDPIGCQSDSECRDRETCIEGECVNPCLVQDPCGRFAECYPAQHRANCRCLPGYEGDPFVGCEVIGCRTDPECPSDKACRNKDCINPCLYENPCAPNAECLVSNHVPQCRCPIGYTGNPRVACIPIPPPECVQDEDCPSQHACLDNRCQLLCPALSPCRDPATCSVIDSLPVRTMICTCPDGFVASEDNSCKTLKPILSGCSTDDECGETDSCINKICKDPCACGDHAFCRVFEHKPVCTCEEGYEGNPDVACIKVECRVDDDCLDTHACRNEQCRPVCGPGNAPCGGEAICTAVQHKATCACPPGLEGDPFVTCREIDCRSDRDCPSDKACYNNHCISPCTIENPCVGVAECTVVGHQPNCECPPGFEGSKGTSCTRVQLGCRSDSECPSQLACIDQNCTQPCDLADPCGRNAKCTVLDTEPVRTMVCICITGYQGNAAVECTPVPTCPPGRGLILNEREECVCPPGHYTNDEGVCVRCPTELGFVLIGNQCICDSSRGLVLSPDGTKCICPPGFVMGPDGVCEPDLECRVDDDCIDIKYCEQANNTCGDPCVKWPCGANAYGTPGGHRCACKCIEGYQGDPYNGCIPIPVPPTTPGPFPRPDLEVNCLADGVLVNVGLVDDRFKGVMYVKGHSNDERCRQSVNFLETGKRIVDFKVLFGVCGLFHSDGEANFVLVIQKHPKLVTYKSQAYRIRCVYNTGIQQIDVGFNVSMLTTAGTIANTGPPPTCSMRICNSNGEDINRAEIGDALMLKVDVQPNAIYGGFARSCVAHTMDDNDENEYLVTDEDGCATDPSIFGEWQYNRQQGVLTSVFNAFKFPSTNNIRFQCNIRVCFGQCQPQNCAGSNAYGRKKRQADDVEDAQVYTGQLREEIQVQSNAILTIERRTESRIDPQTSTKGDEDVCVSKIGFIIALVITALLALVAVAIAVSCWLMAYRRRPKTAGPLPHPAEFPNPLFTTPTPPLTEPAPDYLS